ncbi:hypothetical protein RFM68_23055 [Mesorhizobium sp. MSK_1335]|uniref:Uncharacterized protein n=1 Tax=Mesorhizobium montanum TaxID=3072323 RepID=A0ABU4ZPS5_9HYPH|nr:hypothetical protein [Mesorhizobium sp. MSK_1335]MDX8527385.1 hypothetical protein [Mesorhizobium sp. MSK_1335]
MPRSSGGCLSRAPQGHVADNPHAAILDQAYFDKFLPVAVKQLALGGLHLAAVLNETLAVDK